MHKDARIEITFLKYGARCGNNVVHFLMQLQTLHPWQAEAKRAQMKSFGRWHEGWRILQSILGTKRVARSGVTEVTDLILVGSK